MFVEQRRDIYGQEIHRVHQQYPDEYRKRQRRKKHMAVAVEDSLHLIVDEAEGQLDKRLTLVRYSRGRAADDPPEEAEAQDPKYHRRHYGIDMQGPERALTDRMRQIAQMVLDVSGGSEMLFGGHDIDGRY